MALNIGVDVDGVLVDMEGYQLKYGAEYFSRVHNKKVINAAAYDIEQIFECTFEEREQFWKKYIWTYCLKEPVIENAPEIISKLRDRGHKIIIITGRAHTTENNITGALFRWMLKFWLRRNRIIYDDIAFCSEKDSSLDKYEACIRYQIDIMIDDKLDNLAILADRVETICYPAIWNKENRNNKSIYVEGWNDIYDKIIERE